VWGVEEDLGDTIACVPDAALVLAAAATVHEIIFSTDSTEGYTAPALFVFICLK
jgi:hypothetical protein